jgi:hypothetical protein
VLKNRLWEGRRDPILQRSVEAIRAIKAADAITEGEFDDDDLAVLHGLRLSGRHRGRRREAWRSERLSCA